MKDIYYIYKNRLYPDLGKSHRLLCFWRPGFQQYYLLGGLTRVACGGIGSRRRPPFAVTKKKSIYFAGSSQTSGLDFTEHKMQGRPTATHKKAAAKHFSMKDSCRGNGRARTGWAGESSVRVKDETWKWNIAPGCANVWHKRQGEYEP